MKRRKIRVEWLEDAEARAAQAAILGRDSAKSQVEILFLDHDPLAKLEAKLVDSKFPHWGTLGWDQARFLAVPDGVRPAFVSAYVDEATVRFAVQLALARQPRPKFYAEPDVQANALGWWLTGLPPEARVSTYRGAWMDHNQRVSLIENEETDFDVEDE